VHSGSFAPAFTLSFHDSECSRKPPNAHSLGRQTAQKPPFLFPKNLKNTINKKTAILLFFY
jgi:hypothetical protein